MEASCHVKSPNGLRPPCREEAQASQHKGTWKQLCLTAPSCLALLAEAPDIRMLGVTDLSCKPRAEDCPVESQLKFIIATYAATFSSVLYSKR